MREYRVTAAGSVFSHNSFDKVVSSSTHAFMSRHYSTLQQYTTQWPPRQFLGVVNSNFASVQYSKRQTQVNQSAVHIAVLH